MTIIQRIKAIVLGYRKRDSNQPLKDSIKETKSNDKVQEFLEGRRNHLSAKDVFTDIKIFEPVKTSKNPSLEEIKARLKNAKKSIPLPRGYKDACICMRMLIRRKIEEKKDFKNELKQLYKYACEHNFFDSKPYLEDLKEPSFNLTEVLKKSELAALHLPYEDIGYEHISILNKTDIKWLVSAFGEPNSHTMANEYHKDVFQRAVSLLKAKRDKESEAFLKELRKL